MQAKNLKWTVHHQTITCYGFCIFFYFSYFKINVPFYFFVNENLMYLCPNIYFTRFPLLTYLFSTAILGFWWEIYYWNFLRIKLLTNFKTPWMQVINKRVLWKIKIKYKLALFNKQNKTKKSTSRTNIPEHRHSFHNEEYT